MIGENRPFRGLRPPASPAGLRSRVLDAARRAESEPIGWIERLWRDSRLWWAVSLAFVLLVVAHLAIDSGAARNLRPRTTRAEVGGQLYEGLVLDSSRRTLDQQRQDLGQAFPDRYGPAPADLSEEG